MKKQILFILITIALVIAFPLRWLIETKGAYDWLERKTEWCYVQNGIMIEVHCFSKDMKLIEIPPNVLI